MPELVIEERRLRVELSRPERIAAMRGSFSVQRDSLVGAELMRDPLAARRGVRALGTWVPWVLAYGTYRRRGEREFVAARRHRPGLRLTLRGEQYAAILISLADPEAALERLGAGRS